jgi:GTP cyclohydrolase I
MSRLYLALEMLEQQPLTPALLRNVLQRFLDSHEDLSKNAYLRIHTDLLLKRPALVSPLAGWKAYPVSIEARGKPDVPRGTKNRRGVLLNLPMLSGLARQLIQQQFLQTSATRPAP